MLLRKIKKFCKDNGTIVLFIAESKNDIDFWLETKKWRDDTFSYVYSNAKDDNTLRKTFQCYDMIINLTDNWSKDIILKELGYCSYEN